VTRLCHIKCDLLANFYISLELEALLRRKSAADTRWRLQTVASIWIRVSARRSSSPHGPSDAGMVEGELHRLHRKGPIATKLTRPQPTRLPCVGCDASSISQTSVKAKNHPRAKMHCIRSGMTCHRQRSTKLSTTFANVWTRGFRPMVDILSIWCELGGRA